MSIVVAAMIGSVITGKVTNKWGKRQACLGSLLFIVVGLAVMALSTTSANYYLMAAGQCICGLGGGHGIARHAKSRHGTRSQSTSRR